MSNAANLVCCHKSGSYGTSNSGNFPKPTDNFTAVTVAKKSFHTVMLEKYADIKANREDPRGTV